MRFFKDYRARNIFFIGLSFWAILIIFLAISNFSGLFDLYQAIKYGYFFLLSLGILSAIMVIISTVYFIRFKQKEFLVAIIPNICWPVILILHLLLGSLIY